MFTVEIRVLTYLKMFKDHKLNEDIKKKFFENRIHHNDPTIFFMIKSRKLLT